MHVFDYNLSQKIKVWRSLIQLRVNNWCWRKIIKIYIYIRKSLDTKAYKGSYKILTNFNQSILASTILNMYINTGTLIE